MIKPTLFIGLGTTGTEILKQLRELMSEEFGDLGLPIFRYISIETREAETGDNKRHFKDYEKITVVNATIDNPVPVGRKLDPNQPQQVYNPHLTDWLDPRILHQVESYSDGARNIRMAGRLCLWENWQDIRATLNGARNAVRNPDSQADTLTILRQHYESKNLNVPTQLVDLTGINVYVVGTLCGGSCSGMLIDMTYFLRDLLGDASNIYGIFTMFDRPLAEDMTVDIAVRAANCYASLSEFNYYNNENTVYDVTFPNNRRVNTKRVPFDYAMFVSPTGRSPAVRFIVDEKVDIEGLNLMVALNLFAESVGDPDEQKEAIRADWIQFTGYGGMKPVPAGETPTMVKCMASFGLTAVWYPKYRIASAAASLASKKLCQNWKRESVDSDSATIKAEATQAWNNIAGNAKILTSPLVTGQATLEKEIETLLNTASHAFQQIISHTKLSTEMNACPRTKRGEAPTPFKIRFTHGGKYYDWMQSKVDNCKEKFCDAIDVAFENQISNIEFQGGRSLGDVRTFFRELDQIIEQEQQQCPSKPSTLELRKLDFVPMGKGNNIWTKLAGNSEEAVREHRNRLIQEFRQLVDKTFEDLQAYFLREVLEAVRAKLGFAVHTEETTNATIYTQLTQIETNLSNCVTEFEEDYEDKIQLPTYRCVRIVTNNPENVIQTDAESLCGQIIGDITLKDLLGEQEDQEDAITMYAFLKKGHTDITKLIAESYQPLALSKINSREESWLVESVVTKAYQILEATGEDIEDLARRSNPYQEFEPGYSPFDLSQQGGTKIIFGHDTPETNGSLNSLQTTLGFDRLGNSIVDHLLFFYEEESSFTLDDLAAYEALKQHFDNNPGVFGHWTHKDPDFYNLTLAGKRGKLDRWCDALANLVREIRRNDRNRDAFNNVFEFQNEDIIFRYRSGLVIKRLHMSNDKEERDELYKKERDELCRLENEVAYNRFFNVVTVEFNNLESESVTQAVTVLTDQVENADEQHELTNLYERFLQEVYPNFDPTTISIEGSGEEASDTDLENREALDTDPGSELSYDARIQQISDKPKENWTPDEQLLMQGYQQNQKRQQNSGDADSAGAPKAKTPINKKTSSGEEAS